MHTNAFRLALAALLGLLVVALLPASPAHAVTSWAYVASTGGTQVKALDATVTSDLTAASAVAGTKSSVGKNSQNSTAAVDVATLANVGAVETSAESFATDTGFATRTTAEVANVSLLGGLIRADALRTVVTNYANDDGTTSSEGGTEFIGLHIAGIVLPADIPKNYVVGIPGVASVMLNWYTSGVQDDNRFTIAGALGVTLLDGSGEVPAGARVIVNPSVSYLLKEPPPDDGARLGGWGFATAVHADAAGALQVTSSPTAVVFTPQLGSHGEPVTNTTATVSVPGILKVGAATTTSVSDRDAFGDATITNTVEVAEVNLLGGLVTADAVKVTAHGEVVAGAYDGGMDMELVNLEVAGTPIDLDVAPNTKINIANLGSVTINEQVQVGQRNRIRAVVIELDTATVGLPVGSLIRVGEAFTAIS